MDDFDGHTFSRITVKSIENGYLVKKYEDGNFREWYCADPEEIKTKLERML